MSTDSSGGGRRPRMALHHRLALLVAGALIVAAGLGFVSASLVGMLSGTSASEEPAPPRRLGIQEPDYVHEGYSQLSTPTPRSTPRPTSSPTPTPGPPPPPPLGDSGFQVIIPQIGVNAPVNTYGMDAQAVPEVPYNGWEVAWYDWSSHPGTGSNAVFAGHVTWGGAAVFYNLGQLGTGEEIVLRNSAGAELKYRVEANYLVDPDDPDSLSLMGPTEDDMITVITCGGDYFYTGGPLGGDYTNRRIVRARLSQTTAALGGS